MNLNLKDMIAEGIRSHFIGGLPLLYWEDVKGKYPEFKVHPADIVLQVIDGVEIKLVRIEDIQEKSDLDKKIQQMFGNDQTKKKPPS